MGLYQPQSMSPTLCWIAHRDPTNPLAGGAERSIFEICRGLSRRGWNAQLIAGGFPGADPEELLGGIRIIRGSGPASIHIELPALLKRCDSPDVVVEDLGHVVPFLSERFTQSPGVVFFRHLHRRTLPGQVSVPARLALEAIETVYPLIYRRWPFVVPSPSAVADLVALGFDQSRLHLISYGVDLEAFRPGTLSETPSIIHFAGLRGYKRPQHAVHALKILMDNGVNANLFVVGNGSEVVPLKRLSRTLGIDDHVNFTGRLSDAELGALISQSWVHVQCSIAEGWGLTVLEAAASGVPTVAYRVPGLVDSVSPGVTGTLVEDGNVQALASSLALVIRNRPDWSSKCRQAAVGHSWEMVAREWDTLLKQVSRIGQ